MENPYKKYSIFDPLGGATKTRETQQEQDESIGEAPSSIINREVMDERVADNFFYIPDLGDVPEIDVPTDLPNLDGVAADLNFISDLNEGIAPSLLNMTSLPDLPVVEAPEPDLPQIESKEAPPAPPDPAPQTIPPPPPPSIPPPPPVDIPPPPPISVPAPPPVAPSSVPVEASADSARSDLLASIRNAGGIGKVKLKSSKERRMEKKKEAQIPKDTSSSSGGGDLMGDLFAKIAMRRIGISGSKHPAGNPSNEGSALEKISAMIPPPTAPTASVDEEDDDEWD